MTAARPVVPDAPEAPGSPGATSQLDAPATAETFAPRGLLAIFAHPDDETFGAGGTMALAAAGGVPTWIVCATDGDQGGAEGARELDPELRRGELRCAMTALGVAEPIFLGYGDSGMEGWAKPTGCLALADEEEVVERLVAVIRDLRPATVVTFDPGGIYGHPDHVAISARATVAFHRAAAEPGGPRRSTTRRWRGATWRTGARWRQRGRPSVARSPLRLQSCAWSAPSGPTAASPSTK